MYIILVPIDTLSQNKPFHTIYFDSISLSDAIVVIEKSYDVKISYANEFVDHKVISLKKKSRSLTEVLDEISTECDVTFQFVSNRYIVLEAIKKPLHVQNLDEVVITGYLTHGISKNWNGSFTIKPKELEILPGLTEADILTSIQELPGVISPNETATELDVRGGTPDQNQIIWDGITIYHRGNLFGMISPFNPNIAQNVIFYDKGTNPRYGERISSVIDIRTNNDIPIKKSIGFGLNGTSADAYFETPIITNKLSLSMSYRKSYQGLVESGTFQKIEQKVFQNSSILDNGASEEKFSFQDYNIKVNYKLNKKNTLLASFIHIDNDLNHIYRYIENNTDSRNLMDSENEGYSIHWNKKWDNKINQVTKLSYSFYGLNYRFTYNGLENKISKFDKNNQIKDYDFSMEVSIPTNNNQLNLGYQTTFKNVNYAFLEVKDSISSLDENDSSINSHSLFLNYSNRNSKQWNFDIGLRANYYDKLNSFRLEPRIVLVKNLNNNLKIQATGEIRNQIIYQIEKSTPGNLSLENKLWRLANGREAPIIKSNHVSLGALYHQDGWSFDFDSYYKKNRGISFLSYPFLNETRNKHLTGEQRIFGIDFYVKKDFDRIKTWVSYSLNETDDKIDGVNNANYFTDSNEINHAISTSISYKLKQFQIALGWKWHTGRPYTLFKTETNDNTIGFSGINTEKLPIYHSLDVSSIYNFSLSKRFGINGKVGLSIRNLYNRENTLIREYTGNSVPKDPILVADYYSLPITPNVLFRVYW